jgi:hypothetical protein
MHLSGELSPPFITPAVSPALLMWMRGSRGWYALQTSDVPLIRRREIRRWKIAAPLIMLYFAGVAIAGTMPSRADLNSASVAIKTRESHDHRRRQFAGVSLPIVHATITARKNERMHTSYYRLYDDKRRQASGGLLSIGSEFAAVIGTGGSYESHDRKRRQFTPPYFHLPKPTTVVEAPIPPRTGSASPKHRLHAQAPRRSVDYPYVSGEQDHVTYIYGSGDPDILTSSISRLPPIEPAEVITGEAKTAEKHAGIDPSFIPKPSRKPSKPIKSVKALTAKVTPKKVAGRCRNRIWRC